MKSIIDDEVKFFNIETEENEGADVKKIKYDKLEVKEDRVILKPKSLPEFQVRTTLYQIGKTYSFQLKVA